MSEEERKQLLRKSWTQIARQYEQQLVPRFLPWNQHTVEAFCRLPLPPGGPVLVPACGPGHEVLMLARHLPPDRQVVGTDLAEGMVEVARERIQAAGLSGRASAEVGDACSPAAAGQQWAGVVCCFGLQQLPGPVQAVRNWLRALLPGGVAAICYWPGNVEDRGPWKTLAELSVNKRKPADMSWELEVTSAAAEEGAEVLADELPQYTMTWPNASVFWQVMTEAGPWHSRLLQYGPQHMEELRQAFMAAQADLAAPLEHRPRARLLLLRRATRAAL